MKADERRSFGQTDPLELCDAQTLFLRGERKVGTGSRQITAHVPGLVIRYLVDAAAGQHAIEPAYRPRQGGDAQRAVPHLLQLLVRNNRFVGEQIECPAPVQPQVALAQL